MEYWARDVIARVERGVPIEDSRVELKSNWIDSPNHVARLIAGHCNASAGGEVLWLFGVDESSRSVVGVEYQDMATWWAQVAKEFDEQPPSFQEIALTHNDHSVVAVLFSTDRIPFVLRNEKYGQRGGAVQREVPWREGTSLRNAKHSDLVRLLVPVSALPRLEVRKASGQTADTWVVDLAAAARISASELAPLRNWARCRLAERSSGQPTLAPLSRPAIQSLAYLCGTDAVELVHRLPRAGARTVSS